MGLLLSTLTHFHVTLHLGNNTSPLVGWPPNVSFPKTFFLVNSVYTNDVLNARIYV